MTKLQKFFARYDATLLLLVSIFAALCVIIFFVRAGILWDGAVYVGMGKFLFSYGVVGNWELIRPPLLPIVLGVFWKIGLDPYVFGSLLVIVSGAALVWLVYRAGKSSTTQVGVIASLILMVTPVFLGYVTVPTTDIISTFFACAATYIIGRALDQSLRMQEFILAGLLAGIAFLFRFPQGIVVLALGLVVVLAAVDQSTHKIVFIWRRLWRIAVGFLIPIGVYLIANLCVYGDMFSPLISASKITGHYNYLYDKGFWFYPKALLKDNPLYWFVFVPIIGWFTLGLRWQRTSKIVLAFSLSALVFVGYFMYQPHKELRYAIAFLPYLALLAGYGIVLVTQKFKVPAVLCIVLIVLFISSEKRHEVRTFFSQENAVGVLSEGYKSLLSRLPYGARVLSTNAYPFAISDTRLVRPLYYDWSDAKNGFEANKSTVNYVLLDSCDLARSCPENASCMDEKPVLLSELNTLAQLIFYETQNSCEQWVYKIK